MIASQTERLKEADQEVKAKTLQLEEEKELLVTTTDKLKETETTLEETNAALVAR